MQIIPTNRADNGFGLLSGTDFSSSSSFMDAMNDAMSSVADGSNVSVSTAMAEESPQLVESPYSMQSTDGVTYTLEEVTFTKSELEELREKLLREGAPQETLQQFDILVDQPDGATLAQVIASLIAKKAGRFSEEDAHAITALLGQIDPSGTLAGDAIALMRQGNGVGALGLIQDALNRMPADQLLNIDPDGMMALGRGLGLNSGSLQTIAGLMQGRSMAVNGAQFETLMQPARAQFETDAANAKKLDDALEKTLRPIISKARDRMAKEKEASERESRRVQQSRILIDRTVQQNSRDTMDETLAGEDLAKAGGMVGRAGEDRRKAGQMRPEEAAEKFRTGKLVDGNEAGLAENAKAAVNAKKDAKSDLPDSSAGENRQGKSDGWQELLGKTEVRPAAATLNTNNSSIVYSMLQGNLENQILQAENQMTQATMPQLSQQLAQQVERGVLTAMRDGASRLDLQLHPAELGTIGITLIARNGEVTAQIRSEKSETADLLQRQMDFIRVNLEQQGLKVDKIEVQLENRQDNAQSGFEDLGQHNARQEEETRRQELNRLRNLAALRNEDNSGLAQQLHNMGQQAGYAGQSLHVVA